LSRALAAAAVLLALAPVVAHARTATVSGTWLAVKRAAALEPRTFRLELASLRGAETVPGVILAADTAHFGRRAGRLGPCEMAGGAYGEQLANALPVTEAEARALVRALSAQTLEATRPAERDQALLGVTAAAGRRRRACFGVRVPQRMTAPMMRALDAALAGNPAAREALKLFAPTVTDSLI
jgi:hypothetical protein